MALCDLSVDPLSLLLLLAGYASKIDNERHPDSIANAYVGLDAYLQKREPKTPETKTAYPNL
jgi:hypothetical protein